MLRRIVHEGTISISIKELNDILYEGIAREIIRLHYRGKKFTLDGIAAKVALEFNFNLDKLMIDNVLKMFESTNKLVCDANGRYECADGFNVLSHIPWPDLPRPAKQTFDQNKIVNKALSGVSPKF
ncbi:MAG: hypothetical protein GF384_03155 [Elusimicrobia bacterium]|nr:hypothetical protein [Elusimicrobiota bacterium]